MVIQTNASLHHQAERNQLLRLNAGLTEDNLALRAALQEAHAILAENSQNTDDQRIALAKSHIVRALARWGTLAGRSTTYQRTK
jgi:hypothetical protein